MRTNYSKSVSLGIVKEDDLSLFMENRNRLEVREWCRQVGLISERDQKLWYERQNDDPTIRMFSIYFHDELSGMCGLTSIDHINRRAEFSLYLFPEKRGCGIARHALIGLLRFGFKDLNLNLIWGESFSGNPAMKLFTSIGMREEGKRREFYFRNGRYIDAHLFSVTNVEFSSFFPDCSQERNIWEA